VPARALRAPLATFGTTPLLDCFARDCDEPPPFELDGVCRCRDDAPLDDRARLPPPEPELLLPVRRLVEAELLRAELEV
jgi:hypothetical protein